MTRMSRTSNAPLYAAIGLAVLGLFVAATTTAFAAGLAANSVGAKQLKKNAVTAKKIKNDAVTGPKIKKGAITADKLAAGVLPTKSLYTSRELSLSPNLTQLGTVGGLTFVAACNSALQDFAELTVDKAGGGDVTYQGINSQVVNGSFLTQPVQSGGIGDLEIFDMSSTNDGYAMTSFDGIVTPAGGAPVRVQATVRADDGNSVPCRIQVLATPVS